MLHGSGTTKYWIPYILVIFSSINIKPCTGQTINRAPQFLPGGDMAKFSIPEDTKVGSLVYQLNGIDPEGSDVHYSISGEHLTVDKKTGAVRLLQPLDREELDLLEVIISITDEGIGGSEPNTVSLRREISVLDVNDNPPVFHNRPYAFAVEETENVGTILYSNVSITDADGGVNADVMLSCSKPMDGDDYCSVFDVRTEKVGEGRFVGIISLAKSIDYEHFSAYNLVLKASDMALDPGKRLTASANVAIEVKDIQDQPPVFLNAPYSATVAEGTEAGASVLTIRAKDGDLGDPRHIVLSLEDDYLAYFALVTEGNSTELDNAVTTAKLVTTNNSLDREHSDILQNGGIYSFKIKATELVNNDTFGDTTTSQVTIVITDVDDQIPSFNQDEFHINVSEDTGIDTPIPGLNLVAYDRDVGENARYTLKLRDVMNSEGTFKVQPQSAKGHTPVVIKVADVKNLDYDVNDPNLRKIIFEVVALVKGKKGEEKEAASTRITIDLVDANDNAPEFSLPSYRLRVPEDVRPGSLISNISATDKDSGLFGQLTYVVKGFGSEKFKTHPTKGGLHIAENSQGLDYENQQSYSLTFEAQDGGKKVSTVNVFIEVDDVNDNAPVFEMKEYTRTVREGATHFEPQLFIRATDADGPDQGGNKIFYSIKSVNAEEIFFVEPVSGELILNSPAHAADTPNGQYELVITASDAGVPRLHSDVHVVIRVGVPGNQRPLFRGTEDIVDKPFLYTASVKENVKPGTDVLTIVATDPDGQDSLLEYFIAGGAKDNFIMDRKLGKIKVSPYAHLDYESGGSHYDIIVHVVDAGTPIRETATATVAVEILDVNNKPPVFPNNDLSLYTHYLSEQAEIGESVMNVTAYDPDTDSILEYSIIEPIRASDRTGVPLKSTAQHIYKDWFKINSSTGEITIAQPLDHNVAAVVILTVQAKDLNAKENIESQIAKVEVTIYIQAYSDSNPVFTLHGWSGKNNIVKLKVPEEQPLGTVVFRLTAKDPANNKLIKRYEKLKHESKKESEDFFKIGVQSGDVILNKRLDFEQLQQRVLSFQVRAFADDGIRTSVANVVIEVQNINDNSPKFNEESYNVRILESAQYPQMVLSVHATDHDANDNITFYGRVSYSISGENANLFTIDAASGVIQVAKNVQLDREKQQTLKFFVIASDTPQGGANQRKSTAMVTVEVLDVNDNAPQFNKNMYSAVVPENVPVGTHVLTVAAVDPDEGLGGEISFDFSNEGEANRLFSLNHTTGNITTRQALTGKGRTEPYQLMVRAQDKGKPSLSSDVPLVIHIGDVFANDGVPVFIRPKIDEQAYISENSSIGSPVFQVQATDPDDPNTPNGKILFKFLNDKTDSLAFSIDSHSGLITSSQLLDRETKDKYALVIVAQDQGNPPQQATRMLLVHITDIDDHKPIFRRKLDDEPLHFSIPEELDYGTEVGEVEAVDEDLGDNGKIDYLITFGNEDGLFSIKRSDDNKGIITVAGRVDRETAAEHMLTVKCFKLSTTPSSYRKQYNKQDPSYQQIKIIVEDIDDNMPEFVKENITIGVRLNVPVDTSLLTLEVVDKDSSTMPVFYNLLNTTFYSLAPSIIDTVPIPTNNSMVFQLDEQTGELRTTGSMLSFVDGYFELKVTANNSDIPGREISTAIKIFVLRDRDLLKFVFGKPPTDVRKSLADFKKEVEKALLLPVSLNIYDTQFYAKEDGSLDFSSTSSCFQLVGKESYDLNDMQYLLQDPENTELDHVYAKYGVQGVQHCTPLIAKAEASWIQLWVLAVACFIGLAAFTSGISVCCLYSRYKHQSRRSLLHEAPPVPVSSIGYLSSAASGPTVVLAAPPLSENTHMYEWVHDGTVLPSGHDNMSYQSFPVR